MRKGKLEVKGKQGIGTGLRQIQKSKHVNDVSSTEDRLHDESKSQCILVTCGVLCIDSAMNRRNRRLHEDTGTEVTYRGQPLVNLHRFSDESSTTGSQKRGNGPTSKSNEEHQ